MEEFDEGESASLKSSSKFTKKESRRRNRSKLIILEKNKKLIYYISISIIAFLILIILIYIFYKLISTERDSFNKQILTLNEEKNILEENNQIIKDEYEEYKKKLYLNLKHQKKKIVAISYASEVYKQQLEYNKKSALEVAKVDEYYGYGPEDIDPEFKRKNNYTLSHSRGNGFWLWKPYFILKTLKNNLNDGDYLIYSDACILYIDKAHLLVDFLNYKNAEMYLHRLPHLEKHYTKRDAFLLLGADLPFFTETGQFNAAFQVYKKSKFTEIFLEEYLYYAEDKRIITDDPNTLGLPNYEGFIDHRHDQSILSLLTKKYSQVNANKMNIDVEIVKNFTELMPTIFCHYRQMGFSSYEDLKQTCKEMTKNINNNNTYYMINNNK